LADATPTTIEIRAASSADAGPIADVWLRSFGEAFPGIHRPHSDDEVRAWIRSELVPVHETWVATADGRVVALMALTIDELAQLYVDPDWQGQGIGDALVTLAKRRRPNGLRLFAFQRNRRAIGFYERRGFVEVDRSDGQRNMEQEPDVTMEWQIGRAHV